MDTSIDQRDCYDLCYKCAIPVSFDYDPPETVMRKDQLINQLRELDSDSESLRTLLETNDTFTSAINFASCQLEDAEASSTLPLQPKRSLVPYPSRCDALAEKDRIKAREASALESKRGLIVTLKKINKHILLQTHITTPAPPPSRPPTPTPQDPPTFYRVTHSKSHTSHNPHNLGFWSARGLPDHNFAAPSEEDFIKHMKKDNFASPYISLTTDPGFACTFDAHIGGREVVEIDAVKLWRMGVCVESTVDIAKEFGITYLGSDPGRLNYVTPSHWVARYWVPAECCVATYSLSQFEEICLKAGFLDKVTKKGIKPEDLPAKAYEKLECLLNKLKGRPNPEGEEQDFADESDDETTLPPGPLEPIMVETSANLPSCRQKPPTSDAEKARENQTLENSGPTDTDAGLNVAFTGLSVRDE